MKSIFAFILSLLALVSMIVYAWWPESKEVHELK
ncbi:hypothetical protein SAMN05444410_105209 [Hydrobacter penzbergensis]|jgi:hypothetical protein|uniref:Uncharacterized protein n=1 Tax=Hydrobacter penzbergensis TaxID=1235997 RepID=A0A8X8LE31_9BACT|nr:hypothetical protein CLV53_104207 [Sediminibacterium magnilacihabitans]SDW76745.1 hypothetical protein SAMN05444410_105209 [Hydrobacter penzbergensis]